MKKIILGFVVLSMMALIGCTTVTDSTTTEPAKEGVDAQTNVPAASSNDDFAKCLTDKGIELYTTSWCPHCKNQKDLFGSSVQYLKLYTCDLQDAAACEKTGVESIPAWKFPNQKELSTGTKSLEELSQLSGCSL